MSTEQHKVTMKKIIWYATIIIGLLTLTSVIWLGVVTMENIGGMASWRSETILGSLSTSGLAGLIVMVHKFMDNRSAVQKAKDKQKRLQEINRHKEASSMQKFNYKLEIYKWKLHQENETK